MEKSNKQFKNQNSIIEFWLRWLCMQANSKKKEMSEIIYVKILISSNIGYILILQIF